MTDYKLVPVEPTAEMVEAAGGAYMPFGDMELAIRMAVLAAPAVPRGWDDQAYASMRDEVEYHKRRADDAEMALSRIQEDLAPTHMGELVIPAWTGWACQYPGKMPRLYGSREIAELNFDPENGDQLLFLASSQHPDGGE